MNIREISVIDLLSKEEKADMMLELLDKRIFDDFHEWEYSEQEKYILDYKKRIKG